MEFKGNLIEDIENKLATVGILLDMKKTFDSGNHKILLKKMKCHGMRNVPLSLFTSYLDNRHQVTIFGYSSEIGQVVSAVLQGSVLGPTMFSMYIIDVVNLLPADDIVLYADDTNVFFAGSDMNILQEASNIWLFLLSVWFKSNILQLNVTKTKYIMLRAKNKAITNDFRLHFEQIPLTRVSYAMFLGVVIEEHILWTERTDYVCTEMVRSIGIFHKFRTILSLKCKLQIYFSLLFSNVQYSLLIWGTTTTNNIANVFTLQKRAVREIANLTYFETTRPSSFYNRRLFTIKAAYSKKLAVYIRNLIKENKRMIETTY